MGGVYPNNFNFLPTVQFRGLEECGEAARLSPEFNFCKLNRVKKVLLYLGVVLFSSSFISSADSMPVCY